MDLSRGGGLSGVGLVCQFVCMCPFAYCNVAPLFYYCSFQYKKKKIRAKYEIGSIILAVIVYRNGTRYINFGILQIAYFHYFFIERKVLNLKCFNNEEDVTPFLTSCGVLLAHPSQKVHFVKNLVSTNRCLLKIYFSTF